MPTNVEQNLEPVDLARHENDNIEVPEMGGHDYFTRLFVSECGVACLEDISEFETLIVEKEINNRVNTRIIYSAMRTQGVELSNRGTISEGANNYDENYRWTLRATKIKDINLFQIKRGPDVLDLRSSNSLFEVKHFLTPNDIMSIMRKDHGVYMGYKKAWKVKEKALTALDGFDKDAYRFFPHLAFMLHCSSPGSIVALSTDENDVFRYFFVL
ncbi:hypothetical protein PanWU01x14_061970 [Parasponia andersonii]|uniref:Uncharacterized protein n=1 Tax=Parasponia andersonii TaxID=3476 RepID=A0A2P5DIA7_PARAD|nr:hypothetical protein PanWU01x14_061970 [Parasponia andersonii]